MHGPLDQFVPSIIFGTFTDAALACCLVSFIIFAMSMIRINVTPNTFQLPIEMSYNFVLSQLGENNTKYAGFMMTIFWYILIANLIGIIPCVFSITSYITCNFVIAMSVFLCLLYEGLILHTRSFIQHFFIPGIPFYISPFLACIELIVFILRPIILTFRLCLTVTAGHILLEIFSSIADTLGSVGPMMLLGIVPILFIEILISLIQAMVFTMLSCMYIKEITDAH